MTRQTLSARPLAQIPQYEYDWGLLNGRFQIVHEGHLAGAIAMLNKSVRGIINIGSINQSRDTYNPFTFEERCDMWRAALNPEQLKRIVFIGQEDIGNPVRWASAVERKVSHVITSHGGDADTASVAIFGHRKDATSFYLDDFPNYVLEPVDNVDGISATGIRDQMFHIRDTAYADKWLANDVPPWTVDVLRAFMDSQAFTDLVIEQQKNDETAASWNAAPYPVIFNTADAIIVQGNKVLLVKRRGYPGKGLWALPGGFLGHRERVVDSAIREATEETGIDVSKTVLRNSLVDIFFEDNPWRSTRGRTITFASIFQLKPTPKGRTPAERRKSMALPHVRGMDDAELADWKTFDEVRAMRSQMFEDHAIIIDKALDRLGVR